MFFDEKCKILVLVFLPLREKFDIFGDELKHDHDQSRITGLNLLNMEPTQAAT